MFACLLCALAVFERSGDSSVSLVVACAVSSRFACGRASGAHSRPASNLLQQKHLRRQQQSSCAHTHRPAEGGEKLNPPTSVAARFRHWCHTRQRCLGRAAPARRSRPRRCGVVTASLRWRSPCRARRRSARRLGLAARVEMGHRALSPLGRVGHRVGGGCSAPYPCRVPSRQRFPRVTSWLAHGFYLPLLLCRRLRFLRVLKRSPRPGEVGQIWSKSSQLGRTRPNLAQKCAVSFEPGPRLTESSPTSKVFRSCCRIWALRARILTISGASVVFVCGGADLGGPGPDKPSQTFDVMNTWLHYSRCEISRGNFGGVRLAQQGWSCGFPRQSLPFGCWQARALAG